MSVTWYLARHVADLARGETRNVGVVLVYGDTILSKFVGENSSGALDGRRLRSYDMGPAYRDWVAHWRRSAQEGPDALLAASQAECRRGNYYLEFAGELLVGEAPPAEDVLEDLFGRLVSDASKTVGDPIEETVAKAAQLTNFPYQRDLVFPVDFEGATDSLHFDFRIDNRVPHLMKRVSWPQSTNRDASSVHAAAWTFERIRRAEMPELDGLHCIALVKTPIESAPEASLRLLEKFGAVVEAANPEVDATKLAEYLESF